MLRKFIIRTLFFLAIMFVIDRVVGMAFNYLSQHPKGGMTAHRNHLIYQTNEDVLIFGSSRARYHYNPEVVTEMTGLSCFNCGEDGNGILLFYAWWKLITQRYQPKVAIYDVTPLLDIVARDNYMFLWRLRRMYDDQEEIQVLFDDVDSKEKWKMYSQMYRYNSTFTELAADYIHPMVDMPANGYVPRTEVMKPESGYKRTWYADGVEYDSLRVSYLDKLARDRGATKLVFVASPIYAGMNPEVFKPIVEISEKYGVPFYNYSNDPRFLRKYEYFRDNSHLNAVGADLFTRCLMEELIDEGVCPERGKNN